MGFKIWWSWGVGISISKLPYLGDFFLLRIKLVFELEIVVWVIFVWFLKGKSKQKWEKEKNNTKEKRKSRKGGGEGANPSPKNPTGSSARALLVQMLVWYTSRWASAGFFYYQNKIIAFNSSHASIYAKC